MSKEPIHAVAVLAGVLTGCAPPDRDGATHAIVGAMPIDVTAVPPVADSVVLVENGKIAAMGRASEVPIPNGARRVYGRRQVVFPRIVDQPLSVDGPADLILCEVNPARDPDYMRKTAGGMEQGRWTQFPDYGPVTKQAFHFR